VCDAARIEFAHFTRSSRNLQNAPLTPMACGVRKSDHACKSADFSARAEFTHPTRTGLGSVGCAQPDGDSPTRLTEQDDFRHVPVSVPGRYRVLTQGPPDSLHARIIRQPGEQLKKLPARSLPVPPRMLAGRADQAHRLLVLADRDVVGCACLSEAGADTVELGADG
jgi:hypothetical protein